MKKQCNKWKTWSVDWNFRPLVWSAQPNPAIAPVGVSPTAQYYRNMLVGGQYHIQSHKLDKIGATPILQHPNALID